MGQDIPSKEGDAVKFGWCGPIENALLIARVGFDFIEVPLAPPGDSLERVSFDDLRMLDYFPNLRLKTNPTPNAMKTALVGFS